jgi:hypothetical protein
MFRELAWAECHHLSESGGHLCWSRAEHAKMARPRCSFSILIRYAGPQSRSELEFNSEIEIENLYP